MKARFLAAALIALPTVAGAQSQLDRLQSAAEAMNAAMMILMTNQMTQMGADPAPLLAAIPDMSWDDEMRAAGSCMLDRYTDTLGQDGVDDMLDRMQGLLAETEAVAEAGGTVDQMPDGAEMMPEGLTAAASAEITQSCGMIELQMQRMEASGFTAAMMSAMQ